MHVLFSLSHDKNKHHKLVIGYLRIYHIFSIYLYIYIFSRSIYFPVFICVIELRLLKSEIIILI